MVSYIIFIYPKFKIYFPFTFGLLERFSSRLSINSGFSMWTTYYLLIDGGVFFLQRNPFAFNILRSKPFGWLSIMKWDKKRERKKLTKRLQICIHHWLTCVLHLNFTSKRTSHLWFRHISRDKHLKKYLE